VEGRRGSRAYLELRVTARSCARVCAQLAVELAELGPLEAAGMETTGPDDKLSMHALRHYAASMWLAGGVNIKAVAEYLGHADAGFTLRVYAHLMPSAADAVRAAMDASLVSCAPEVPSLTAGGTS